VAVVIAGGHAIPALLNLPILAVDFGRPWQGKGRERFIARSSRSAKSSEVKTAVAESFGLSKGMLRQHT
jgi:hypothetical protein